MPTFKAIKAVAALPAVLEADAVYYVRVGTGYDTYVTNGSGTIVAYQSNLRDRSTHTGTQLASTISDLASAVRGIVTTRVQVGATADLNSITTPGVYYVLSGAANVPPPIVGAAGYLDVNITSEAIGGSVRLEQIFRQLGVVSGTYRRVYQFTSNTWSGWSKHRDFTLIPLTTAHDISSYPLDPGDYWVPAGAGSLPVASDGRLEVAATLQSGAAYVEQTFYPFAYPQSVYRRAYLISGASWSNWSSPSPITAAGDIIVGGPSGVPARLPIGSANRVLRVNAAATGLEWVDPGVYGAWSSTQQTYTNGGQLTLNHNLGYIPRDVSLELVFTTATNNWAAGMTMQISVGPDSSSSSRGAAVRKTSTQLIIRIATGGLTGIDYSTGAAFDIPPASVALVARVLG